MSTIPDTDVGVLGDFFFGKTIRFKHTTEGRPRMGVKR